MYNASISVYLNDTCFWLDEKVKVKRNILYKNRKSLVVNIN